MEWQAKKSASTRVRLIETAIDSIAAVGYTRTTTALIAERTRLSRGALLHHFPSKASVISEVINHIYAQRLHALRGSLTGAQGAGNRPGSDIGCYVTHFQNPSFVVLLEIAVVARGNDKLAAILRSAHETFERKLQEFNGDGNSGKQRKDDTSAQAMDFTCYAMEGMLLHCLIRQESPDWIIFQ